MDQETEIPTDADYTHNPRRLRVLARADSPGGGVLMATIERGSLPQDNFTMLSNGWLRDKSISFKARGVLSWLSSHALGFRVSLERIAAASECDGVTAVRSAVKELEAAGYLVRQKLRDESGRITSALYILQDPNVQVTPIMRKPHDGSEDTNAQVRANMRFSHDGETPSLENSIDGETSPLKKNKVLKKTKKNENTKGADLAIVPGTGGDLELNPENAQDVVGAYIDWCRAEGNPVAERVKGHLGREVKDLLTAGFEVRTVKLGLAAWHKKGAHPSALASFVQQTAHQAAVGAFGGTRTEDRVNMALSLAEEFRAEGR